MKPSNLTYVAALPLLFVLSGTAYSQTATTQFNVQITINAECLINSAGDLTFPATGVIDAAVDATSDIAVQCTNGTDYDLGLDAGQGAAATVATRQMTGPGAETVDYSLYTDPARSTVWGNTVTVDTVAGTGTGTEQVYTVYGQVPTQDTPTPGTYNDIITVTLTY
ncbi:spore coat U domain-containing protein [Mesorhizobium sp. SB112]|uniref:Csu type fimbrial protein n=1 Tax=Mesorhizobium sp. SB112 TaxID=3151853 RepID=UPI003266D9C0